MRRTFNTLFVVLLAGTISFGQGNKTPSNVMTDKNKTDLQLATFGTGCFWCTEAIFQNVVGVEKVESGY
jgi:peptide-methionine (S)-S-oxide reductase